MFDITVLRVLTGMYHRLVATIDHRHVTNMDHRLVATIDGLDWSFLATLVQVVDDKSQSNQSDHDEQYE